MKRPELEQLAAAGATVMIEGRILEARPKGDHVDLMLKACTVRQVEHRMPTDTHEAVKTDHLWLRLSREATEADPALDVPTSYRHLYARPGIQMLERVTIVGVASFYTHADGSLGIGVPKVLPLVPYYKLQGRMEACLECFQTHPWRKECLKQLETMAARTLKCLAEDWVLTPWPAEQIEARVQRVVQRAQRDHAAEVKARRGRNGQVKVASLPGMNPLMDALLKPQRGSAVEALLEASAADRLRSRRYGHLS